MCEIYKINFLYSFSVDLIFAAQSLFWHIAHYLRNHVNELNLTVGHMSVVSV